MTITNLEEVKPGKIKFSIEGDDEEIKQVIALETGRVLATGKDYIHPTLERLSKILYVRDLLASINVVIDPIVFNVIKEEELDGLIKAINNNYVIPEKMKIESKFSSFIWKLRTGQVSKIKDFYIDLEISEKASVIKGVFSEELLIGFYLCYVNELKGSKERDRVFKTLKWFAINDYYNKFRSKYLEFESLAPAIESVCLLFRKDFKATSIFSVFRYFTLLENPEENIGKSVIDFKAKDLYKYKLSREERRKILGHLDYLTEGYRGNLHKRYRPFVRALEKRLHPKDYKELFPNAYRFFMSFKKSNEHKYSKTGWITNLYKENKDILEIASLVYEKYPIDFIYRFDSFVRRAEKEGRESDLLEMLIDTGLDKECFRYLANFYERRIKKLKAYENAKENNKYYIPKPTANLDFVDCVLDIINIKLREYE